MFFVLLCFALHSHAHKHAKILMHEYFILAPGDGPGKIFMHESLILAPGVGPGKRFMHESFILAPGDGPGKRFMHESFILAPGDGLRFGGAPRWLFRAWAEPHEVTTMTTMTTFWGCPGGPVTTFRRQTLQE